MRAGFAVLYRWRVRDEDEESFVRAWAVATKAYRTVGALGSRLHRGDDGSLYAYAEWPSREAWESAGNRSPVDAETAAVMRAATIEFEAKPLEIKADLLGR